MEDVASAAVTEATKGILDKVPETAIPYVLMVFVVVLISIGFIFIMYKVIGRAFDKSVEEIRRSYDSIVKSQQDTIRDLIQGNNKREEENK